jgi:putative flippase GtrA
MERDQQQHTASGGLLRRFFIPRRDPSSAPGHTVALPRNALASLLSSSVEAVGIPLLVELVAVHYLHAVAGCMLVATTISFFLNKYWVFEARRGLTPWQYAKQLAVTSGTYGGNIALIWTFTERVGLHYYLAWACSNVCIFFIWSYPGGRWIVFSDGHKRADPAARSYGTYPSPTGHQVSN